MPESTFILRFTLYSNAGIEEQEHSTAEEAWDAFRSFAEPDSSEIYSKIELLKYNWVEKEEYKLARMDFGF